MLVRIPPLEPQGRMPVFENNRIVPMKAEDKGVLLELMHGELFLLLVDKPGDDLGLLVTGHHLKIKDLDSFIVFLERVDRPEGLVLIDPGDENEPVGTHAETEITLIVEFLQVEQGVESSEFVQKLPQTKDFPGAKPLADQGVHQLTHIMGFFGVEVIIFGVGDYIQKPLQFIRR